MKNRNIPKSAHLVAMLSILGVVPALSLAAQVAIPGTSVSMEAPPGFTVSRNFSGLENAAGDSNILVAEMPAETQEEVAKLFSDPGAAKSFFAQQGISIDGKSILTVDGKSVPFLTGSQSKGDVKFGKYMALIHGDMTVMIQFTIRDPRSLTQAVSAERMLVQYLRVQHDGILIYLVAKGARAEMDKVKGAVVAE